jgi:hypothetical protein
MTFMVGWMKGTPEITSWVAPPATWSGNECIVTYNGVPPAIDQLWPITPEQKGKLLILKKDNQPLINQWFLTANAGAGDTIDFNAGATAGSLPFANPFCSFVLTNDGVSNWTVLGSYPG